MKKKIRLDMNLLKIGFLTLMAILTAYSCKNAEQNRIAFNPDHMMVRISEIEVAPDYLDEYISILRKESEASVRLEPGVISIYPMIQKENTSAIRILEIYANKDAYESHLQTPHFKEYKTTTLKMVKSLKLIDMEALDWETMPMIFKKLDR